MHEVAAGATSQLIDIFIQDSSKTDGSGLAGLVYNSASLAAYYKRQGASSWTAMTLVTMTQGTWTSLGFIEGDATHAKGVYEFGIPNAAIASAAGVDWVDFSFYGATNMAQVILRVHLRKYDDLLAAALDETATGATVGAALNAARAQGFGKWAISGNTLTLYASNGTTVVKTFTLAPSGGPFTSRT